MYEKQEAEWLAKIVGVVGSEEVTHKHINVSWAAFHTGQAPQIKDEIVQPKILLVFTEASNTLAMVKDCLTVILRAHSFTNPGKTPWVAADQPLFALLKIIQWCFPNTFLEFLVLFTRKKLLGHV